MSACAIWLGRNSPCPLFFYLADTRGADKKKRGTSCAVYTRGTAPAEVPALQKLGWRPPVFGLSYSPWWSKPQAVAVWQRSAVGQWVVHWPIRRAGAKQCRASAPRGGSGFYPTKKPSPVFTFFLPYFHRLFLPRCTSSASVRSRPRSRSRARLVERHALSCRLLMGGLSSSPAGTRCRL